MDGLSFNLNMMDNEILMTNMSDLMYQPMSPASMKVEPYLETAHGPYLQIIEEPKQRGFRFRYECEGPSHGGLPGASSEKNKKTYPTVKVGNHIGRAKVEVQLVTHTDPPRIHAHSLVGKHCNESGSCSVIVGPTDLTAQFNNLGILHVTRRGAVQMLTRRLKEERMKQNGHDHLTELEEQAITKEAKQLSSSMDLNVVRLKFTAYLQDSHGDYTLALKPAVSNPIYDSKSPNASNLKISRMDKTCGSVLGGDEIFLLCDKVQKDDIEIRFYEDEDGSWEALGDFSPTDVHKQYAIVFKTPQYHTTEIERPVTVFLQLKRKKGGDCSEAKQFTYVPLNEDKEEVMRKKQKPLPDMYDHWKGPFGDNGGLGGPGGLGGSGGGGGSGFQFRQPAVGGGFGQMGGGGGAQMSDESQHVGAGSQLRGLGTELQQRLQHVAATLQGRTALLSRQMAKALLDYCRTGDVRLLLAVQRHLCAAQDENGDTPLHLAIINQQMSVVEHLVRAIVSIKQQKILDTRNHLQQTPLHLAVITGQPKVAGFLLGAGADPSLLDRDGRSAVHLAAALGDEAMLRAVLAPLGERHAHLLNAPDHSGLFPLHLVVRKGAERCLRALMEAGACVNTAELKGGCTALHLAVTENLFRVAFMLITELKVDVNAVTFGGNTPLHLAASLGSPTLCSMLLAADDALCSKKGSKHAPKKSRSPFSGVKKYINWFMKRHLVHHQYEGAQKHVENDEPLFGLSSDEEQGEAEERVTEGEEGNEHRAGNPLKRPLPGHTPFHLAKCQKVRELLECKMSAMASRPAVSPTKSHTDDVPHLDKETLQQLDGILSRGHVPWKDLAEKLGLLTLADLFQETPSPCQSLLESYQVGGGQVAGLVEALESLGLNEGVMLLRRTEVKEKTQSTDATVDSGFGSQVMDEMEQPVAASS